MAPLVNPRQTLVVSGFWRSGTTWLQESLADLLAAKMMFEPFHYSVPETQQYYREIQLPEDDIFLRAFLPYAHAPLEGTLARLVRQSLRSTLASPWARNLRHRPQLALSLRRRVVVKFVRAQLCLRAIHDSFGVPVVHLYRDPRAVIASAVYKTDRMWGNFEPFSLRRQLLEVSDGRAAYFGQWVEVIHRFDEKPFPLQFAAYWMLTERFLADSMAGADASRVRFVQYEQIAAEPDTAIPQILSDLSLPFHPLEGGRSFHKDSPSTTRRGQTSGERVHGWMKLLSETEIREISALARDFGFADRLVD